MRSKPISPVRFDPSGVFLENTGLSRADLLSLAPQLEAARQEVLDAPFIDLPHQLLTEYITTRPTSQLHRLLQVANQLRDKVDRVVVLGSSELCLGPKALMDALCDPYFNELTRGQRGSRPRIYFEGNNFDNDATQGLLNLLGNGRQSTSVDDRWGIVVISKSGDSPETAVAFRHYLAALRKSCSEDEKTVTNYVIPVTGSSGKLFDLTQALGCQENFPVPDGIGTCCSIFSAVGLMPAAILGIDVVKLLEGAVAMNEHFRTTAPGENIVLDYVAIGHLLEKKRGVNLRGLSIWAKGLETAGLWYEQLRKESIGKAELRTSAHSTVNSVDLHSRVQHHQKDLSDRLITNVIVDHWRCDPLPTGRSEFNHDQLNELASKTLPDLLSASISDTNQAHRDNLCPIANLHLPTINAASLGQFFQWMMLATVVEERLP